jgi:hypothetical protein
VDVIAAHLIAAAIGNKVVVGASLDQSIKQLPTRTSIATRHL